MTEIMSRYKWKLWFLTVTVVYSQLFSCNLSEVGAVTITFESDNISSKHRNSLSTSTNGHGIRSSEAKRANDVKDTISATAKRLLKIKTINTNRNSNGYAAEWEYKGSGLEELDGPPETEYQQQQPSSLTLSSKIKPGLKMDHVPFTTSPSPSRRLGPGTWMDSKGYWWLFGGQGPSATNKTSSSSSTHYLSDLWVYGPPSLSQPKEPPQQQGMESLETDQNSYWRLVYRPESYGDSPLSSHPENLRFPVLCGSSGHLSLFRGQTVESPKSPSGISETHNSLFTEDSVVWLYDIPKTFEKMPRRTIKSEGRGCNWSKKDEQGQERSCNGTEGLLWTSYICCDACLPDGNTTFDFCPQFSREPILWCNQDSLMAFQLTINNTDIDQSHREISNANGKQPMSSSSTSISLNENPEVSQQRNTTEVDSYFTSGDAKVEESLSTLSHISQNRTTQESMINGSNSQGVGQPEKVRERIGGENEKKAAANSETWANGKSPKQQEPTQQEVGEMKNKMNNKELKKEINIRKVSKSTTTTTGKLNNEETKRKLVVNWFKFDIISKEWMKMPEVNINVEDLDLLRNGNCRTVSDQDILYILCPSKANLLDRSVLLFDPRKESIYSLGTIHLNNAFHDKKVWHLGRSVFHALRNDNQTVIFLAYHKLLDLWIHDHKNKFLKPVSNVWRGSSLHAFQNTFSFYKLTIVLPSTANNNNGLGKSIKNEKKTQHSFYMVNPRSKLFNFDDPFPDGHFQITIVTDRDVFLPSRDAPYLNNSTDFTVKSAYISLNDSDTAKNQSYITNDHLITISTTSGIPDNSTQSENTFTGQEHYKQNGSSQNKFPELPKVVELRKSQGLSFNSTENSISYQPTSYPFTVTKSTSENRDDEEIVIMESGIPDTVVDLSSQSKSNPHPGTQKKSNKTNNSQLRGRIEVVSANKNKRILGIKRTFSEATKIDSEPQQLTGGNITISRIASNDSLNTMSRGSFSSLPVPVNNESNRKPLSTSATSTSANSKLMPEVMKVLNGNSSWVTFEKRDDLSPSTKLRNKSSSRTTTIQEAKSREVNLSIAPEASALKVAVRAEQQQTRPHPHFQSLPGNLGIKIDQAKIWTQSNNSSSSSASMPFYSSKTSISKQTIMVDENHNQGRSGDYHDNQPNLENNYAFSHEKKIDTLPVAQKNETFSVVTPSFNDSFMGDMDRELTPLTYGSSEIVIDSSNDHSITQNMDSSYTSYSTFGSILFFSLSLSIFATFGLVVFIRRCVKCPPSNESVLLKEPPPIRYSVIPDELSFHTPIV